MMDNALGNQRSADLDEEKTHDCCRFSTKKELKDMGILILDSPYSLQVKHNKTSRLHAKKNF